MLFYAIPIISTFLPPEYANDLFLLVVSMDILLSDSIIVAQLDVAHQMLSRNIAAGDLYSHNFYTANMRSLIHTVPLVRLWGPLWAYSMFQFEHLIGYLGGTFHGTCKVIYQMSFQVQLSQTLPDKLLALSEMESPEIKAYVESVVYKKRKNMQKIDSDCYTIGKLSAHTLTDEARCVIRSLNITLKHDSTVQLFERLMMGTTTYCSE